VQQHTSAAPQGQDIVDIQAEQRSDKAAREALARRFRHPEAYEKMLVTCPNVVSSWLAGGDSRNALVKKFITRDATLSIDSALQACVL
jgi:hypothetical protein